MKTYLVVALLIIGSLCYGQKAKINCASQTKLKKDVNLGYLNLRGVQLGEIYTLKISGNKIKNMSPLGKKIISDKNIDIAPEVTLKQYETEIDFTLDASADINPALKTELTNDLTKAMSFKLYNSKTKMIINPTEEITYFDPNLFPIKSGEIYALINRITVADSLIISTKSGLDINASVKVKFGQYDVQVINNCNGLLRIKGREVPAFFEFLTFMPKISTENKPVVGVLGGKSRKIRIVTWEQVESLQLAEDFEN